MQGNHSKLITGLILVLLGVGLLSWVLINRRADAPANTTTPSQQSEVIENESTANQAEPVEIIFTNEGFNPREVTVKKGTTVTVKNDSETDVQFSSDEHPTHLANSEMNLPVLSPGESDSFSANTVGEWGFHDHIDDTKTGTITVTE